MTFCFNPLCGRGVFVEVAPNDILDIDPGESPSLRDRDRQTRLPSSSPVRMPAPRLFGSCLNAMLRLHVVRRVAACNHIAIYLLPDASKRYARLRPRRAETNPPPFAVHLNF